MGSSAIIVKVTVSLALASVISLSLLDAMVTPVKVGAVVSITKSGIVKLDAFPAASVTVIVLSE